MSDRKLYSKIELNSEKIENKSGNSKVSLEYYLLKGIYEDSEEDKRVETFGIQVVKKEYKEKNIMNIENEYAEHLSINKEIVEKLLDNMAKNYVTPFSLHTIIDDLLGVEL